jgi:predicted metal-dependent peptidase
MNTMADTHLTRILAAVDADGCVKDSAILAKDMGLDHKVLVGCIKSLEASESIVTEVRL